jgi:hypothetical protein
MIEHLFKLECAVIEFLAIGSPENLFQFDGCFICQARVEPPDRMCRKSHNFNGGVAADGRRTFPKVVVTL